ncbi:type II secretory pathway component PulK [Yoonia maricola]|uniref:Type II secretory pathway component PulK n=1 Tax=Yoonia maricola TaxID=420999 RepID=A0A2M8W1Y0_9RHOB|nr:type II secretion system protein GspK [Yoonia maricola]PJI84927.1 type II secretory pathway component PulK [Yoonia maricola]
MTQRRGKQSRGYILITVLWIGLGLLLAVAAFMASTREEALSVRAEVTSVRAQALARSGLNIAMADLGRINRDQIITRRDGTPTTVQMAEGNITYRIYDEGGKLDVLQMPPRILAPALIAINEAEALDAFDAINLADTLPDLLQGPRGEVRTVYTALTDAGLSNQTALTASRYLTTLNFRPSVNPRTAPAPVLSAIPGIGASDVAEIITRRETNRPMPILGSAAVWLVEQSGPAYTIEAEAVLNTGGRALMRAQVITRGLSFRGGLMRYDVLSTSIVR